VAPALKDQVKTGDVIFLSARAVDPQTGETQRTPIAVDRIDVSALPIKFRLTSANSMMGGELKGNVLITARVDRDKEAMTRQPGDIEGTAKATVPAGDLKIVLDTPVTQ
jgi:hypothetical protein